MKITIGEIIGYSIISAFIGLDLYGVYTLIIHNFNFKDNCTPLEGMSVSLLGFTIFCLIIFIGIVIHDNWDKTLTINFKLRK